MNVHKADVSLATFNSADVSSVEFAGKRESFLGESLTSTQRPRSISELQLNSLMLAADHQIMEAVR